MNNKWLIIDCNFLCHRAKHATGGLSHENTPTGVIFGFLKTIRGLQELFHTDNIVFCWDSKTSKRKEIFPDYKKKRSQRHKEWTPEEAQFEKEFRIQMKKLRKVYLKQMGYRNVFCQKGYEGDDIMASICQNLSDYEDAIIVTSDKDLYQCIRFNISFYNPMKGKVFTLQKFKKKYGITSREWACIKAIAGCSTDEVPGIKGVGELTAIRYLRDELKPTSKIYQRISEQVADIYERNIPLVELPMKGTKTFKLKKDRISQEGRNAVFRELGIESLGRVNKHRKGLL